MNQQSIALVTGGNRGVGRATALRLAESGTDVILTYRSHREEAAAVVGEVRAQGRRAVALQLDTTGFGAFPAFTEGVHEALKATWDRDTFDFLVNNAGLSRATPMGGTSAQTFDLLVDVHFKGVFFLTQALLPLLADHGRIVNLSSSLTRHVNDGASVYASLKGAIETLSKYLASELGGRGISVNALAPGWTPTDLDSGTLRDTPHLREELAEQTALGRVATPEDIGAAIAALLAPGTGWITAQRIEASGGGRL